MLQITNLFFDFFNNIIALDFANIPFVKECPEVFTLFMESEPANTNADDASDKGYDSGGDPYYDLPSGSNGGNAGGDDNNDDDDDKGKKRKLSEPTDEKKSKNLKFGNSKSEDDLIKLHKRHNTNYEMILDVRYDIGKVEGKLDDVRRDISEREDISVVNNKVEAVRKDVEDLKSNSEKIYDLLLKIKEADDRKEVKSEKDDASKNDKYNNHSPLEQFVIKDFIILILPLMANVCISITNMTLYLTIAFLLVIFTYILSIFFKKIKTSHWYISIESVYATIHSIVVNQINTIKGQAYFPFMYTLFVFILINNLIGMVPYSFSPTSHFALTFFLSFTIVFGATILGFVLHKLMFFALLVPNGCPLGLLPLLVLIETISYLARNVSLGLRLAANILSGHMLLNILSEFTYKIMDTNIAYFFIGIIPLTFIGAFSSLELGIAFIQSQVFVVLSSSYTKDSIELH